jgi:hypothetical protein
MSKSRTGHRQLFGLLVTLALAVSAIAISSETLYAQAKKPKHPRHRAFLIVPAQAIVGKWLESFKEYPIRQKPASFNLDAVMQKLAPKD